jgi:N-acetylmuramic acid 6-phosphate etherase
MRSLFNQLQSLTTEKRNQRSKQIDSLTIKGILVTINQEDRKVASAVANEIPQIAVAVKLVVQAFRGGGRLFYVGAGTSGRLGILDASECPPTYGTTPNMVQGIIAGGKKAVFQSQEGSEDRKRDAIRAIQKKNVNKQDVVCGIAASMRTPYVVAAIQEAKRRRAKTILITTNSRSVLKKKEFSKLKKNIDVAICVDVGAEVIMGSTRMKAGTAQKMVLNMISTAAMIRMGKVYENMMVDLKMNSNKLVERAKRILMITTGIDYRSATSVLTKANGHVKTAIIMIKANVSATEARKRLKKADGFVKKAIAR